MSKHNFLILSLRAMTLESCSSYQRIWANGDLINDDVDIRGINLLDHVLVDLVVHRSVQVDVFRTDEDGE
ncbi:hypothetical protein Tco_0670377 [Tanacetum coccineum]